MTHRSETVSATHSGEFHDLRHRPAPEAQPLACAANWLRANLAVAVFLFSLVSGSVGAIVAGTLRIAQFDARLNAVEGNQNGLAVRVTGLENDRHERDERRVRLAADMGVVNQRLIAIEQQAKNIAPLQADVSDMDRRDSSGLASMRREIDGQMATINQRVVVLETQLHWFNDRVHVTR